MNDLSGAWTGWWTQADERGEMNVEITLVGDRLTGQGEDRIGDFTLRGSLTRDRGVFLKRYPSHEILYSGHWDGERLKGTWRLQRPHIEWMPDEQSHGEFELRPSG